MQSCGWIIYLSKFIIFNSELSLSYQINQLIVMSRFVGLFILDLKIYIDVVYIVCNQYVSFANPMRVYVILKHVWGNPLKQLHI